MLYLVGLGLYDENDITVRGLEIARRCDCFIEMYTSKWHGSLENLEKMIGKKVKVLERSDMEENSDKLLKLAKEKDICIFVLGDPLAATTHISFIIDAKKNGIPVRIVHNASIFSAIGEVGLQLYKFGKVATIPYTGQLQSVKDTIKVNKENGLHTLLLLDVRYDERKYMTVNEAVEILIENDIIDTDDTIIAVSVLGSPEPKILYKKAGELMKIEMDTPSVLIIPGDLHFVEKEFLENILNF